MTCTVIAVVLCKHFSGFIETVSMDTGFGYRPYALHSTPIAAADIAIPATSCVETLVSTVLMPTVCVVWHWAEGTINLMLASFAIEVERASADSLRPIADTSAPIQTGLDTGHRFTVLSSER